MAEPRRKTLLVTGSRQWTDRETIRHALLEHGPATIIHGAAEGADSIAEEVARELGWPTLPVPPRTGEHPLQCNQRMVDMAPDACLAFTKDGARGTRDCASRALLACIDVYRYTEPGPEEP